jgi:hypothetical protein
LITQTRILKPTTFVHHRPFFSKANMASRPFIKEIPDTTKFLAPAAVAGTAKLRSVFEQLPVTLLHATRGPSATL